MAIELYCRRCRKSMHITYAFSGDEEAPVLPNVTIKCVHCKRVMEFKKYREKDLMKYAGKEIMYI